MLTAGVNKLTVNLATLIDLVEAQHLQLKLADAQIKQAKGAHYQSWAQLLPSLSAQHSMEKFDGGQIFVEARPVDVKRTTYYPRAFASYEIQTGGRALFQISATKHRLLNARLNYDRAFQKALLDVASSYLTYLRDKGRAFLSEYSLKEAEALVQTSRDKAEAGVGTQFEVLQSETIKLERENEMLSAQNTQALSAVNVLASLNFPLTMELEPEEKQVLPILFVPDPPSLAEAFKTAEENRPDLKQLTEQIAEAKARHRAAYANLFPTVSLNSYAGGVGQAMGDLREVRQGGLTITTELLRNLGVDHMGAIKTAKGQLEASIVQKELQLNEIKKTLAKAYYDHQYARDRLRVVAEKLKVADEAFRIAQARQETGVGINLEVLEAQSKVAEARLDYQSAAMEFDIAQLQLLYETGQLTTAVFHQANAGTLSLGGVSMADVPER